MATSVLSIYREKTESHKEKGIIGMICGDFVCIYVVALGQTGIEGKAGRNECRAQRRAQAMWRLQTLGLPHTLL